MRDFPKEIRDAADAVTHVSEMDHGELRRALAQFHKQEQLGLHDQLSYALVTSEALRRFEELSRAEDARLEEAMESETRG